MQRLPEMIDRQLRIRGTLMNPLMKMISRPIKKGKKPMTSFLSKSKCKGVINDEIWIDRPSSEKKLRMKLYKPLHPKPCVPGVLWLHGGGYRDGVPELCHQTIQRLIKESDCVVIAPDYCLSIEKPYPAALEDAYSALLWMKNHANELGINDSQLMVGGESAGGGLTAALTLYARDLDEVNIAYQMPFYPMIDDRMITESAKDNHAPIWDSKANQAAWALYLGDLSGDDVPCYAAPARATDFCNLPPTCTFVGDLEPFRDETIQYVENLRKTGIPVDFALFEGCYHAFDIICPNADVSLKATAFWVNSFRYAVEHYFSAQRKNGYWEQSYE